jgi:hypothetical protein
MKNTKIPARPSHLTADSQKRLFAYSTAASLGAFFAGQNAEATLVQAPGLGSYPLVVLPQPLGSTNATDHYLRIEGGSITNFDLNIYPDLLSHPTDRWPAQLIQLIGFVPNTNNPAIVNGQALCPPFSDGTTNAYIGAFFGGMIIGNNATTFTPGYHPSLGISYNYTSYYPFVNSHWTEVPGFPEEYVGFKFTSSVDGQNHFGYMDMQVNFKEATIGAATETIVKSVVINDCRYETTPDASVTVPSAIKIIGFTKDPSNNNLVTIDFGPNWANDNSSIYVLETSPTLGPSATWVTDPQGLVTQTGTANIDAPATYEALTYPTAAGTAQFWRIRKQ